MTSDLQGTTIAPQMGSWPDREGWIAESSVRFRVDPSRGRSSGLGRKLPALTALSCRSKWRKRIRGSTGFCQREKRASWPAT